MTTDIFQSIISGIVSGIIASVCFMCLLLLIKPRIKISDKMCIIKSGNNLTYRIKVVNYSLAMITNIRYSLFYCEMYDDGISHITEIKPRNSTLFGLDGIISKKDKAHYAARISYDIDSSTYNLNKNCRFEFIFYASHSLSNTTTCIKKEYYSKDIVYGVFESDKSTKIVLTKSEPNKTE